MPAKPLPPNPNLDHLKSQARDLLKARASRDVQAAQRIREFHPRFQEWTDAAIFGARFCLSDAQLTIAGERGFASWARLKRRIEQPTVADRLDLPHHERIENLAFCAAAQAYLFSFGWFLLVPIGSLCSVRTCVTLGLHEDWNERKQIHDDD